MGLEICLLRSTKLQCQTGREMSMRQGSITDYRPAYSPSTLHFKSQGPWFIL